MSENDTHMDRRRFLKAGTVPATALIAGCSGGGNDQTATDKQGDSSGGDKQTATPQPSLVEKAKQEGDLNIVGPFSGTESHWNGFEDKHGVAASLQFKDMGKTATQLVQEYKANKVSIDFSGSSLMGSPGTLMQLADQGIMRKIPPSVTEDSKAMKNMTLVMNNRYARLAQAKALVLLYNQDLVDDPPTSLDELFSEKWKGKITVDVRDSEYVLLGRKFYDSEEKVKQFCQNLGEYGTPFSSHFDAAKAVARGEVPMGLTYKVYVNYPWGEGVLKEADIPDLLKTGGWAIMGLPAKSPNPHAAELALRYSARKMRLAKFYESYRGKDVYYRPDEDFPDSVLVPTPELIRQSDPKEVEDKWKKWTGFKG